MEGKSALKPREKKPKGRPRKKKQYNYNLLADIDYANEKTKKSNCYGIVLDGSTPYFSEGANKYIVTLKIMDETLHPNHHQNEGFMKATIFTKRIDMLPIINKSGNIIRFHRGFVRDFQGKAQLNCDIEVMGSWVMWDSEYEYQWQKYTPSANSDKTYTFDTVDEKRIDSLRKFVKETYSKETFSEHFIVDIAEAERQSKMTPAKGTEKKKDRDFDFCGMVLNIKEKEDNERRDGYIKVKIVDQTRSLKVQIRKDFWRAFFSWIYPFDVIKIRSAKFKGGVKFRKVELADYSNIIKFPSFSKTDKDIREKIKKSEAQEVKLINFLFRPKEKTTILTKITNDHGMKDYTPLDKVFAKPTAKPFYKVRVQIVEIGPNNIVNWVSAYNTKTKITKEIEAGKKGGISKLEKYMYNVTFMGMEGEGMSGMAHRFFLMTHQGKGEKFFPIPASNLNADDGARRRLSSIKKLLLHHTVQVDLMLQPMENRQSKEPLFVIVDTQIDYKL